jgi:hypothetical protein
MYQDPAQFMNREPGAQTFLFKNNSKIPENPRI